MSRPTLDSLRAELERAQNLPKSDARTAAIAGCALSLHAYRMEHFALNAMPKGHGEWSIEECQDNLVDHYLRSVGVRE
jgi:hypothetical protein